LKYRESVRAFGHIDVEPLLRGPPWGGEWAAPLHTLEPACPPLLPLLSASQSLLAGTSPPLRASPKRGALCKTDGSALVTGACLRLCPGKGLLWCPCTCAAAPPEQACPGTLSTGETLERGSGAVAPPEQACPGRKSTGETLERGSCGARAHVRPRPLYRLALERCPLGRSWKGARVQPRPLSRLALERSLQGRRWKGALVVPYLRSLALASSGHHVEAPKARLVRSGIPLVRGHASEEFPHLFHPQGVGLVV